MQINLAEADRVRYQMLKIGMNFISLSCFKTKVWGHLIPLHT